MPEKVTYMSLQGKVYLAQRDANGNPLVFSFPGNVKELEIEIKSEVKEHTESTTGQRGTDARIQTAKAVNIKMTPDQLSASNLTLMFYGAKSTIAAGTVTAEAMPAGIVAGDYYRTKKTKTSSIVVKDSAGSPATLVLDTDYAVDSADHGILKFLNVAGFTQPFKVDYANAEAINVNLLTQPIPERWLLFAGKNTADSDAPVRLELYRAAFDPAAKLPMLQNDFADFPMSGSCLSDPTKASDAVLGTYGRILL